MLAARIIFPEPRPGLAATEASTPAPRRKPSISRIPGHCTSCKLREACLPCSHLDADASLDEGAGYARRRVKRGEALFRAGGDFNALFAVRSGFFKSSVVLEDGRDQVTGFHMAGEILGLDGIGAGRHAADAIALEDSEVCIIPGTRLERASFQPQLRKIMSRELVRDQGVMLLLGTMRAEERLAAFLLNLSQRFVARGFSPHEFHLRMTRDEIGSYLGLSLETVSRLFSRFHDEGLLSVHQKHVCILDVVALKAVMTQPNA